jgi:hypothetical protein
MNKAFVREPEPDARAFCPNCGAVGVAVGRTTLDHHMHADSRLKLGANVWFCPSPACDTAYFDFLERFVLANELQHPVYPKSMDAPICPCFGFTMDDLDLSIRRRSPEFIRELLAKSKSLEAHCTTLAADGRCCMQEVQRLYHRGTPAGYKVQVTRDTHYFRGVVEILAGICFNWVIGFFRFRL